MNITITKQAALWLDHAEAHLFSHANGRVTLIENIDSPIESRRRFAGEGSTTMRLSSNPQHSSNNENHQHNIAENERNQYFSTLADKLKGYDEILLFGPATAKEQLYNVLQKEKVFSKKTITVKPSDKLTDNQRVAFVKAFFEV